MDNKDDYIAIEKSLENLIFTTATHGIRGQLIGKIIEDEVLTIEDENDIK